MSGLQTIVERVVARLKHDPNYRIASRYSDRQLITVLWHRGMQVARGLTLRARARRVRGTVFRGRRVVVEHAGQFSAGPGLILEDGAFVSALSRDGIVLGRNVTIGRGATLTCTGVLADVGIGITIGNRSAVGAGSFLGGQGGIRIGNDVIIGPGARFFSENHRFDALDRPIRAQGVERELVTVGDDCWIGAGTTVLAGVAIGSGSVIAAGAVVTTSVPPFSVAAGVPARVIRSRQSRATRAPTRPAEPVPAPSLKPATARDARVPRGGR